MEFIKSGPIREVLKIMIPVKKKILENLGKILLSLLKSVKIVKIGRMEVLSQKTDVSTWILLQRHATI